MGARSLAQNLPDVVLERGNQRGMHTSPSRSILTPHFLPTTPRVGKGRPSSSRVISWVLGWAVSKALALQAWS